MYLPVVFSSVSRPASTPAQFAPREADAIGHGNLIGYAPPDHERAQLPMPALALLLFALLSAGAANAQTLTELVQTRLGYMKDVAAYKWQQQLPIENLEREEQVLDSARMEALRHRLDVAQSRQFFQAQIDAAKDIQHYWHALWRMNPDQQPAGAVDLNGSIRPQLLTLGNRIVASLAHPSSQLERIQVEGLSNARNEQLQAAALAVTTYPNQLQQVLASSLLRVGYTGDYPPFSLAQGTEPPVGIDAELARDLAASLGVDVHWVQTSWPTLMNDLGSGQFDIAMSGVSINLTRARQAAFSQPYHRGGKAAIIRCADQHRFSSLERIDQAGTRVVVNPGGTNEAFSRATLLKASLQVHPDNRSIFEEIIAGRADVMFTDQIEVQLQSARHTELCPAEPGQTLSFSQKGYLMPQDPVWTAYVDTWLAQRVGDGTIAATIARHLAATSAP